MVLELGYWKVRGIVGGIKVFMEYAGKGIYEVLAWNRAIKSLKIRRDPEIIPAKVKSGRILFMKLTPWYVYDCYWRRP